MILGSVCCQNPKSVRNGAVISDPSPFSLLLQQIGEVIALVYEVDMFLFLIVQLHDGPAVAFLSQQQLLQHPSVRLLLLLLQAIQLKGGQIININYQQFTLT